MKRQNTGKKGGGERGEHCSFVGHKGARQLGAQPAVVQEVPWCDWCGLTDPFRGGPVLLELGPRGGQPVENEDLGGLRHWEKRGYL